MQNNFETEILLLQENLFNEIHPTMSTTLMESMDNTHNPTVITTGSPDNDMIHKIMFDKKHIALTKNPL